MLICHLCGESFLIDDNGIANHDSESRDNHDLDAEHVPYTLESTNDD